MPWQIFRIQSNICQSDHRVHNSAHPYCFTLNGCIIRVLTSCYHTWRNDTQHNYTVDYKARLNDLIDTFNIYCTILSVMLNVIRVIVIILSVTKPMISIAMLSVIMLSCTMLSVIMLSVILLSVIMLSVVMLRVAILRVVLLSAVFLDSLYCHDALSIPHYS